MIKIVDSIMGSGKTQWAISHMNSNTEQRFIYITPYNDEIQDRIIPQCPKLNFKFAKEGKKFNDFKHQLQQGKNIVATHECFKLCDEEIISLLESQKYTLIMDEVAEVITDIKINKCDIEFIIEHCATVEGNRLIWHDMNYSGRFSDVMTQALNDNVYVCGDSLFIWTFPCNIFSLFKDVYVMTYLFPAQIQKYYFDIHGMAYEYYKVCGNHLKGYSLVEHDRVISGKHLKPLINIYEGKLNDIGDDETSLSKSWYEKRGNKPKIEVLRNNVRNYFRDINNATSNEIIWTTFSGYIDKIKGGGYSKGHIPCNARATNKYKDRTFIAYTVNRYYQTILKNNYFKSQHDISINEDAWALSELLQLLWRSAIRENKAINLYIPSKRMRTLLVRWLNDEISIDYNLGNNLAA